MALVIENRRRVEKRSTVAGEKPTIPSSNDHTDGSWIDTDIYEGEFFYNLIDGKIYSRESNTIVEINFPNTIISGLEITNGSDAVSFTINAGTFRLKNRLLTHLFTTDEVVVADGDLIDPRIDVIIIDNTNTATVIAGTPAPIPTLPIIPVDTHILGYVLVPANHVAGSSSILPITNQEWADQGKTMNDWVTGTAYFKNMIVIESKIVYRVTTAHRSDVFATDLGNVLLEEISFTDGNGIYGGSGDLLANTTITGGGSNLYFTGVGIFSVITNTSVQLQSNSAANSSFIQAGSGNIVIQANGGNVLIQGVAGNNIGLGTDTPIARVHIKGLGTTSATSSFLVQNSVGADVFKINDDLTGIFGTYVGAKGNRTILLINGNPKSTQSNAIGLHVKGNIDNNTNSTILKIEHTSVAGGSPTATSSIVYISGGSNRVGSIERIGLRMTQETFVGMGADAIIGTQINVNNVFDLHPTPPNGTVTAKFNNGVNRTVAGLTTKKGVIITSTGVWSSGTGTAQNIGLDVTVSGGDLNYVALFNGGNVGVDITAPTARLHIKGSDKIASSDGFRVDDSAGTKNFNIQNDGVVVYRSFLKASLPSVVAGGVIRVSDEVGGDTIAYSDGVNWKRVSDGTIVA